MVCQGLNIFLNLPTLHPLLYFASGLQVVQKPFASGLLEGEPMQTI